MTPSSVSPRWRGPGHMGGRAGAVALSVAMTALASCAPDTTSAEPPIPVSPSLSSRSTPSSVSPSPSSAPAHATDDVEQAVDAYYDGFEEVIDILLDGGSKKPTKIMRETMSGDYLHKKSIVIRPREYTFRGRSRIDGYKIDKQTPSTMVIAGCENETDLEAFHAKTGEEVVPPTTGLRVRYMRAVKGNDGRWRIDRLIRDKYLEADDWSTRPCTETREHP